MKLRHDTANQRFIAEESGGQGVLDYDRIGDRTLNYKHTYVPPALRGQGIASELVIYALDYARDNALGVVPSCPFVARVIEDNPEYRNLIARLA